MENIDITKEQFIALNNALKKVDKLTVAMATPIAMENTEILNKLRDQREDAIFDIRIVILEQGLPISPLKFTIVYPF